jgi:hypothetical protein
MKKRASRSHERRSSWTSWARGYPPPFHITFSVPIISLPHIPELSVPHHNVAVSLAFSCIAGHGWHVSVEDIRTAS